VNAAAAGGMSDLTGPTAPSNTETRIRVLQRIVVGCILASGAALALAVMVALRAREPVISSGAPSKLAELTVERLNVVEPDGTPRMIISSRARFPGMLVRNKDIPRPDRRDIAGIIFVNDEGTENGGLVQGGKLDENGKVAAGLSLTFDRFRQDQMLQLLLEEADEGASAGVIINDRPSHKVFGIEETMRFAEETRGLAPAERDAAVKRHAELGHLGSRRAYFGTRQGSARLVLNDPKGRPRLALSVSSSGEPSIELLDEAGQPVRTIDARKP
jgi:hypothetical protein